MFRHQRLLVSLFVLALVFASVTSVRAQDEDEGGAGANDGAAAAASKALSSREPVVRQQAAEELARLSANEQQKLVEGYYLQEKNGRVKLALAWALYRMSKSQMLFQVVRDLDSSRADQAAGYLKTLDAPDPLYMFLSTANRRTQVELLKVLAEIGNEGTLAQIKPLTESFDPKIKVAADTATRTITERLAQTPPDAPTRPRQVGNTTETSTDSP